MAMDSIPQEQSMKTNDLYYNLSTSMEAAFTNFPLKGAAQIVLAPWTTWKTW